MERFKNFIDTTITNVDGNTRFIIEDTETQRTYEMSITDLLLLRWVARKEVDILEELNADLDKANRELKSQNFLYEDMLDECARGAEICKCAVCREYTYIEACTHKDEWGKPICDDCYDKMNKQ